MKTSTALIAVIILMGIVLIGVGMLSRPGGNTATPPAAKRNYLHIGLTLVNGSKVTLSSYLGHIVVVEFMNVRCPHCVHFLPTFRRFRDMYRGGDVIFISVSVGNTMEELRRFVIENNVDWLVARDSGALSRALGIEGVPTVVFIDRDGEVYKVLLGEQSLDTLRNVMREIGG